MAAAAHPHDTTAAAADDARALIAFADGMEEAGYTEFARRARTVARATLELAEQLADTRSALTAMQADRDRWRDQRWHEEHQEGWPR